MEGKQPGGIFWLGEGAELIPSDLSKRAGPSFRWSRLSSIKTRSSSLHAPSFTTTLVLLLPVTISFCSTLSVPSQLFFSPSRRSCRFFDCTDINTFPDTTASRIRYQTDGIYQQQSVWCQSAVETEEAQGTYRASALVTDPSTRPAPRSRKTAGLTSATVSLASLCVGIIPEIRLKYFRKYLPIRQSSAHR